MDGYSQLNEFCGWYASEVSPGVPGRLGGGAYMREIGTMWQIGVLTGKPCTFLVQNG